MYGWITELVPVKFEKVMMSPGETEIAETCVAPLFTPLSPLKLAVPGGMPAKYGFDVACTVIEALCCEVYDAIDVTDTLHVAAPSTLANSSGTALPLAFV